MPVVIDQVEIVPEMPRGAGEANSTTESGTTSRPLDPEAVAAWLERARERDLRRSPR